MFIIDIETVPQYKSWEDVPDHIGQLYAKRFRNEISDCSTPKTHYENNAALHAEFGKIVCVGVGYISNSTLRVTTLTSRYEKLLLEKLAKIITSSNPEKQRRMVAHNGKEFDFPFMTRRYFINKLPLPSVLDVYKVKTWEQRLDDTMELWASTQWKYKVSLDLLCECLSVESPKKGMTGADVAKVYYGMFDGVNGDELPFDKEEAALKQIADYCLGDVIALANCVVELTDMERFDKIEILEPK
jgi:predicted PolB exonuclease-like 3'-5' exonuclease